MTRRVVTALLAVLAGAALAGGLFRVRVDTGTDSFLPADDPTLAALSAKANDFGGDPVIVLLRYPRPRQFVADPAQAEALLAAERRLAALPDVVAVYGPATVLDQLVDTARNFLLQLAARRDVLREQARRQAASEGEPPEQAQLAGSAAVAGLDRRYADLVLRGVAVGPPALDNPRFAQAVLFGADGESKPEWRFIVPAPDTAAVLVRPRQDLDAAGTRRLLAGVRSTLAGAGLATSSVTVSGVPTVTAALATEVRAEAPAIGALTALAMLLRYLLVPGSRQRLRPLAASLLGGAATVAGFGWLGHPLSLGTVALLPVLLGVGSSFPLYLGTLADRRRVLVMSMASAAAFAALGLSPLPFVRDLGLALGAGILLTVAAAVALERRWPVPAVGAPAGDLPAVGARPRRWTVAGLVAVALLGWSVLPWIGVSANPVDQAGGLSALDDARAVESTLGASGEISVRLTGPDVVSPDALAWARAAQDVLARRYADRLRPVAGVATLLGFLGEHPTPGQIDAAMRLVPPYLSSSIVRADRREALLVYGVRLQDLGEQRRTLAEVRAALPPPPPGYRADLVGLPVAAVRGYELLLDDRYLANLAGIGVAGLVLALGLRRDRAGVVDTARAVGAALLATGWGLAVIWASGMSLSPLTLGLGSLVGVTGCEFAVLLAHARRARQPWLHRGVGYACLTSVLGYLVLAASRLALVREFGIVLGGAVVLSYLAARLVVAGEVVEKVVRLGPGAAVEVNA